MDEEELKQYREVQTCIKILSDVSTDTRNKIKEKMLSHSEEVVTDPIELIVTCLTEIQFDIEDDFKELLNLNSTTKMPVSTTDSQKKENRNSKIKALQNRKITRL